jgi:hypothetical protein
MKHTTMVKIGLKLKRGLERYLGVILVTVINIDSDFDQFKTDYTLIYTLFSPLRSCHIFDHFVNSIKSINGVVLCLNTIIYERGGNI